LNEIIDKTEPSEERIEKILIYSENLIDHYKNPRNLGEIKNPTSLGEVRNKKCGDIVYFYINIGKNDGKEIIEDISFQTFGCALSVATCSILTEIVKGQSIKDASKIEDKDIADALKVSRRINNHINLARKGFHKAIKNYYKNTI
jgi:nitrogen fixation NifU-like protein